MPKLIRTSDYGESSVNSTYIGGIGVDFDAYNANMEVFLSPKNYHQYFAGFSALQDLWKNCVRAKESIMGGGSRGKQNNLWVTGFETSLLAWNELSDRIRSFPLAKFRYIICC